jgi:hypothetical protein
VAPVAEPPEEKKENRDLDDNQGGDFRQQWDACFP